MARSERVSLIMLADAATSAAAPAEVRAQLGAGDDLVLVEMALSSGDLARLSASTVASDPFVGTVRSGLRVDEPPRVGQALALCGRGSRVLVLGAGCRLEAGALDRLCAETADIVFADEAGFRKPAWSIELALEQDLVGPLALFRRALLDGIAEAPLTTPHDLVLRCAHVARRIGHRLAILAQGPGDRQPGRAAIGAALRHLATERVTPEIVPSTMRPGCFRTTWRAMPPATVSVIIPIRDRPDLLQRCIDGLFHGTAHPVHQVIIVDNGSVEATTHALLARLAMDARVTILPAPGPFNYADLNNRAAALATGEVLLLLNNDIEVTEPGWLDEMAAHALRPDVGAVGARLLYPSGTIQHAGIVLGVGRFEDGPGIAGHFGLGAPADAPGYHGQFVTTREVSAVTAACLAIRREVFWRAGGLDADHLPVALNDLDLCLRLRALGLRVVWTPYATLRHHESASRGAENDPAKAARFQWECRHVRGRWADVLDSDPFYNPYFSRFDHSFLPGDPCPRDAAASPPLPDSAFVQASDRAGVAEHRAKAAEAALAQAHATIAQLKPALGAAQEQAGAMERRLAAEMTAHYQALQREQQQAHRLQEIEGSTAWKLTHPARRFGQRFPAIARRLRQGAKLVWWAGTMQLPGRYALWRRSRQQRLLPPPTPPPALPPPVLPPPVLPPPVLPPPALPPPLAIEAPAAAVIAPDTAPIRLALSRHPVVSVIIPACGQIDATLACLRSFAAHPPACTVEVIVIDDAYAGPEDPTHLSRVEGIVLLRNREHLGYLRSCNHAVQQARGDYIHLLNNDTEIRPGAVDALLALLQSRPDAGLAGSKLLFPDGRLQEAGGVVWDDASTWSYGRGEDPQRTDFTYLRETDYCSAASVMIGRALWNRLGGFDEAFLPACYEDTDLAFRVRAAGLKVLYEPRSEVVKHEGLTHLGSDVKAAQAANQATFMQRWGEILAREHDRSGQNVLRAATRGRGRKTILVIDHTVPEPDRDAGSRSTLGILNSVLDDGWVVKFWPHNRIHGGAYTTAIEGMGIEAIDDRWPGDLPAWLAQHGGDLDHLLVIRPDIAVAVMPHILHRTDAVLSFYGIDLHFARMRRQADLDGNEQLRRDSMMMEQQERRVWRNFDVVVYPSEQEAAQVRSMAPAVLARSIVPFWFDTAAARTAPPDGRTILFVAGFAHLPNTDAAVFLIREIIPLLEAEVGVVRVTLAGSHPNQAVQALAGRDVEVTGYITEQALHGLYDRHRVAVVPLRFGAGVKGKVVESLSRGLPLVTTSIGAQGIDGLDTVAPVADEPAAIVAALKTLLTDDGAWVAQSARQVAFAQVRFSRAAMGRSVIAALEAGERA